VASAHPSSEGTIVGGKRRDVVKLGGQSPDKLTPSSALALSLRKLSGTLLSGQELPAEQLRSVLEGLQKLDAQQSSQEAASAFQWLEPAPEPEPDLGPSSRSWSSRPPLLTTAAARKAVARRAVT